MSELTALTAHVSGTPWKPRTRSMIYMIYQDSFILPPIWHRKLNVPRVPNLSPESHLKALAKSIRGVGEPCGIHWRCLALVYSPKVKHGETWWNYDPNANLLIQEVWNSDEFWTFHPYFATCGQVTWLGSKCPPCGGVRKTSGIVEDLPCFSSTMICFQITHDKVGNPDHDTRVWMNVLQLFCTPANATTKEKNAPC